MTRSVDCLANENRRILLKTYLRYFAQKLKALPTARGFLTRDLGPAINPSTTSAV
jgi:hypothetical protein